MINIKIGSVTDDNKVIHKTFNERATIAGEINFPCDILNPELIVSRETILNTDNYCYIPYFNRYYFINNVTFNGKTKILQLSVDVLKTYENELQNCDITVIRDSDKPTYIVDDKLPINTNSYYLEGKYFPNEPFDTAGLDHTILLGVISTNTIDNGE